MSTKQGSLTITRDLTVDGPLTVATGTFTESLTISGVPVPLTGGGGASTLQEAYDNGDGSITTSAGKDLTIEGPSFVGINTSSPEERLHVVGSGIFEGRVGIGTTSPAQDLHIVNDSSSAQMRFEGDDGDSLRFDSGQTSFDVSQIITTRPSLRLLTNTSSTRVNIQNELIRISNNTSGEVIRISGSSVGVNQTSPTGSLDVLGDTTLDGNVDVVNGVLTAVTGTFSTELTISGVPVHHQSFLNIRELDGSPSVDNVVQIRVQDLTLTDEGSGIVTISGEQGSQGVPGPTGPFSPKDIVIELPESGEDASFFFTDEALTVEKLVATVLGTSNPGITWTLRHDPNRTAAGTQIITGGTNTHLGNSGNVITSFNDATIDANDFVWLETTSVSGTITELSVTMIGSQT